MNENRNNDPALPAPTAPGPGGVPLSDTSAEADTPDAVAARARRGRRLAVIGGALALAAVTVAGVGYTVVTVRDADRDPGAPTLALPEAAPEKKAERAPTAAGAAGLARTLVPYRNDAWSRGPDLGEFGSDATLSGAQATALRKESLTGLPRSERKELEKEIDRRHITGMAMRNYAGGGRFTDDGQTGAATVTIVLSRMGNRSAVRDMATRQNEFFAALDLFREGPRIKGHKDAKCFRLSAETDQELDMVFCAAYEGDVLVTVTADSVRPFDTESFTELVTEQLDRIAEPGESV
ncbi:hypothetical protein NC239_33245 [Streptomyces sp. G3]|uniref:hypothetical protein n=1 Tax=unclassified Streptomyces TaxID=2593676 RepID=UPI002030CAAB|nr:hypothetical protein [Streptomyces sp. G3]MCM1943078.1 hypothetical protein [Streptomyces sp. G3]